MPRLPWISRKKHEHSARGQYHRGAHDGAWHAFDQLRDWLIDSKTKADQIFSDTYADASEEWLAGWHTGQEWINQALQELGHHVEGSKH